MDLEDVDPIYFDHPWFLVPAGDSEGTLRAYQLLVKAMGESDRAALGRFVMRTKEYLVLVRPRDGLLSLTTLRFHDEVRPTDEIAPGGRKPGKAKIEQAVAVIEALAGDWEPERYEDLYRERLLAVVKDKKKGKRVKAPEEQEEPKAAPDLMAALQETLERMGSGQEARGDGSSPTSAARSSTSAPRRRACPIAPRCRRTSWWPLSPSSLGAVSATADTALQEASWDLEPLVENRGPEGVEALLHEARERAVAFAERHRGQVAELDAAGLADAMHELAAIGDLAGRAGSYALLSFTLDTGDPPRGALVQKAQELGAAIETQLLFFELEWNLLPDERAEELLGRRRARLLPPPPAHAAPLPPASAQRARGADRDRAGRVGLLGVPAPVHRAGLGGAGGPARRGGAGLARGVAQPPPASRPRAARADRGGGDRGAAAGAAHARLRVQHAARRQVDQGPPARLPALAGGAQPGQRGERRVGAGADRGRGGPLRAGPALVPAQGPPARPGAPRLLGPDGAGGRQRGAHPLRRGALDRARLLPDLLAASWAPPRARSSRTATSTARRGRASAAARSAPTPCPRATPT